VTSDKYFVVYEQNGKHFSLYGKVGMLYRENGCDFPIYNAFVSDNGKFLIVTRSRENSTCVLLYNEKYALIGKYEISRYLTSCAISNDGKYIALSTAEAENGIYNAITTVYTTSNAEQVFKVEKNGTFPLQIHFTPQNKVLLCCADMTIIYNQDGSVSTSYTYKRDCLTHISYNGKNNIAFVFSSQERIDKSSVNIIDISGKLIYNNKDIYKVNDVVYKDDDLYLLSDNIISKMSVDGEVSEKEIESSYLIRRIFDYKNEGVIAVSNDASLLVEFD
jgi:hypothetical protein